jgi:hypothetical protein
MTGALSLVFREMWDTTALNPSHCIGNEGWVPHSSLLLA